MTGTVVLDFYMKEFVEYCHNYIYDPFSRRLIIAHCNRVIRDNNIENGDWVSVNFFSMLFPESYKDLYPLLVSFVIARRDEQDVEGGKQVRMNKVHTLLT